MWIADLNGAKPLGYLCLFSLIAVVCGSVNIISMNLNWPLGWRNNTLKELLVDVLPGVFL